VCFSGVWRCVTTAAPAAEKSRLQIHIAMKKNTGRDLSLKKRQERKRRQYSSLRFNKHIKIRFDSV
jgi:hypothetical protein